MRPKSYPGGAATSLRYVEATITRVATRGSSARTKYEIAISSDQTIERTFYGLTWRERLSHDADAVQLARFKSGRAAFLDGHNTDRQIGTLKNARIDGDRVLRAEVEWGVSALAKEKRAEIDAGTGVGANVSVGYLPKRWRLIEEDAEKGDLWLAQLWEPVEASSVAVPADESVGFGRAITGPGMYPVETMKGVSMSGTGVESPARDARAEAVEIATMAASNGLADRAGEWIERGLTPDQVGREILNLTATRGRSQPAFEASLDPLDGLSARDRAGYSYARAILVAAGEARGGVEAEVHSGLTKSWPKGAPRRGGSDSILVPLRLNPWSTRTALDTKTPGTAGEVIVDRAGELIELMRPKTMVARAGARILTGLVGNIQFPKKTGAGTVYWVPENPGVAVTETNLTTGLLIGAPKTLMGTEAYSRQFLIQAPSSGVDGESMVRDDLAEGHALALDFAALHGIGANGQPLGIYNIPAVLTNSMGATVPTFAKLIDMMGKIGDANAPTDGLKWLTTPLMAATMARTLVASAAGSDMIWKGPLSGGQMAGYPAFSTNQVSKTLGAGADEHGMILAAWDQLLLLLWNSLELIVDPYAKKKEGLIEVTSFQMADVLVRQPTAFCVSTGAKIA